MNKNSNFVWMSLRGSILVIYEDGTIYRYKNDRMILVKPTHTKDYDRIYVGGRTYMVHRLVAAAFLRTTINSYDRLYVVDHINEDKRDNRACNLQYISQKENLAKHRAYVAQKKEEVL